MITKEEEVLMRAFFNKSTNLIVALQKETMELKENTLINASQIVSIKETLVLLKQRLNLLESKLNSFLENSLKAKELKTENQDQKEYIEKITTCMQVLSSHISVLEKRNRKFSDKFKFGRFKFKSIDDEEIFNKNLKEIQQKRIHFSLNDD